VGAIDTIGRGSFFTLTALYLTQILGFGAVQVGLALTLAGGVGVVSSLVGGHLSDRLSARRMMILVHVIQGLALCSYALVSGFASLVAVAAVVSTAEKFGWSVRSAAIGRAFEGEQRVRIRAIMRTVTNAGIGIGTALAAIPLAIDTAAAYRVTLVLSGALLVVAAVPLRRLEASRVDPRPAPGPLPAALPDGAAPPAAGAVVPDAAAGLAAARSSSPYRDSRFLAVTVLSGLFAIQFGLFEVAVPLWVVNHTHAPSVIVSPLLIVNTVLVVLLSVPLSRGTGDVRGAARAMGWAGWVMAAACALWAWAGSLPAGFAVAVLVAAAVTHTMAEVLSAAAGWSLSYELAPPERMGAYQGVFGTGYALASMVAPAVVTVTAVDMGVTGWAILAVGFLLSALGVVAVVRRATVPAPAPCA